MRILDRDFLKLYYTTMYRTYIETLKGHSKIKSFFFVKDEIFNLKNFYLWFLWWKIKYCKIEDYYFFFVKNKVCNIIIWKILSRNEGKYFAMEFYKMLLSNFNETL